MERFRDPLRARAEALSHVRGHVRDYQVRAGAACRCGIDRCGWHDTKPGRCAGASVLVLIPDVYGRVWLLAETCRRCATAIPRAKIVGQAPSPEPVRSAETAPQRADPLRDCPLCAAEQTAPALPLPEPKPVVAHLAVRDLGPPPPGWTPPPSYQTYTANVLDFLADVSMGSTPAARLTALMTVLRMRRDGTARLIAEDFSPDRLGLNELITTGWLHTSLDAVRAAQPQTPAAVCAVPALADDWSIVGMPKGARKHFNGWCQRLCTHPLLRQQPAGVRLAALAATAASDPDGYGTLYTYRTAARCCFTSRDITVPVLLTLMRAGWLTTVQPGSSHAKPVRFRLGPAVRHLVPGAPAAGPSPGRDTAMIDLSGQERRAAAWTDDYLTRHRHPPPLRTLVTALHHEKPTTPWSDEQLARAVTRLERDGWLIVDSHSDHLVRPGPAYTRRKTAHGPRPRIPSATEALPTQPTHQIPEPDVPVTPDHGYVPDLPLQPAGHRQPAPPAESTGDGLIAGLWRIPGAQFILGSAQQRPTPPSPPGRHS